MESRTSIGKRFEDLNESDMNVFVDYLKKKSPVYPAVEWRITFNGENGSTSTTAGTGSPSSSPQPTNPADATSTTTLGGSNLQVSFFLILMTTIFSLLIKR
jgi:hypothetical protein